MSKRSIAYLGPGMSGGAGFVPGHWRPDAPTGVPLAEPPKPERHDERELTADGRRRDPRTAVNIAAHEAALAPRRWSPPENRS